MSTAPKLYRRDAFRYVPSDQTDVAATWRRFGFKPTTAAQRRARNRTPVATIEAPELRPAITTPLAAKLRSVGGR